MFHLECTCSSCAAPPSCPCASAGKSRSSSGKFDQTSSCSFSPRMWLPDPGMSLILEHYRGQRARLKVPMALKDHLGVRIKTWEQQEKFHRNPPAPHFAKKVSSSPTSTPQLSPVRFEVLLKTAAALLMIHTRHTNVGKVSTEGNRVGKGLEQGQICGDKCILEHCNYCHEVIIGMYKVFGFLLFVTRRKKFMNCRH